MIELCASVDNPFGEILKKQHVQVFNLNAQGKCSLKSQAGDQKTSDLVVQHAAPWLWWHVPQGPRALSSQAQDMPKPGDTEHFQNRESRNFQSFRKAIQSGLSFYTFS